MSHHLSPATLRTAVHYGAAAAPASGAEEGDQHVAHRDRQARGAADACHRRAEADLPAAHYLRAVRHLQAAHRAGAQDHLLQAHRARPEGGLHAARHRGAEGDLHHAGVSAEAAGGAGATGPRLLLRAGGNHVLQQWVLSAERGPDLRSETVLGARERTGTARITSVDG